MAKLQQDVASEFLEKLHESPDISREMIDRLRELFEKGEKLKADDLVRVFSTPGGEVT